MNKPEGIERRAAQRFDVNRSVSILRDGQQGLAFTQDISARGMFVYTDMVLRTGEDLEVVLNMPSEITLSADAKVRCQVRVLRVSPAISSRQSGVALLVRNYEFIEDSQIAVPVRAQEEALDGHAAVLVR